MTKPTTARATRFQHETASASDPIDSALVTDFLLWLGVDAVTTWEDEALRTAATKALVASRD